MKRKTIKKAVLCMIISSAMIFSLAGCGGQTQSNVKNLMDGIKPEEVSAVESIKGKSAEIIDFTLNILKKGAKGEENTLISPLSVLYALSMTANGAEGETLRQMEDVMGISVADLNLCLSSYRNQVKKDENSGLKMANSIWFTDDEKLNVKENFLQTNANYYSADIFKLPFDDQACSEINRWVSANTDEMIPEIIDQIPQEAVMYLVNALAFEGEWAEKYKDEQVQTGEFTKEDGTTENTEFMYSSENLYLKDEHAEGFMKYYSGGKYAFAAMLPEKGLSVEKYVNSLTGEKLNHILKNSQEATVDASIPKFETEYNAELSDILKNMGMSRAFDPEEAEFGALGTYENSNIYINRIIHKTYISVEEQGTKAGAATAIEMEKTMSLPAMDFKEVHLDRPFVYMIVDCENNIPIFMGAFNQTCAQ